MSTMASPKPRASLDWSLESEPLVFVALEESVERRGEPICSGASDPLVETSGSDRKRRLTSDEVLSMWNFKRVLSTFKTEDECIVFAEERGLILKEKICRFHKTPMNLEKSRSCLGQFRCRKSNCRSKALSRGMGTWFEHAKLPLTLIFQIMYMFSNSYTYQQVQKETSDPDRQKVVSQRTIADWFSYCKGAIIVFELDHIEQRPKIGGPHKIVQIEEFKFSNKKYNRDHSFEGNLVIGMIEDGSDAIHLEICPDNERSSEILVPLIQKHVEVGTIIYTDSWRAYDCLPNYGYIHQKVKIHTSNGNGNNGTHTLRRESHWHVVNKMFLKEKCSGNFAEWLVVYNWRRKIKIKKLDPFEELIKCVEYVFHV